MVHHNLLPNSDNREPGLRTASLSDVVARNPPRPESVTMAIKHHVRPESVTAYGQWLHKIVPIAGRFPGHRGVNVIHPVNGSTEYTVTIRFDSLAHAEDWLASKARRELLQEAVAYLARDETIETITGLEFWFHPTAGQKQAKRYKQFLLTLAVIFPLTLFVPMALHQMAHQVPALQNHYVEHFITAAVVVGLMTYLIMPRVTRLVARWLYG